MSVSPVPARFAGRCPECEGSWKPGDLIVRVDENWQHEACPDGPLVDLSAPHEVCTTCWLTHPKGACDRE